MNSRRLTRSPHQMLMRTGYQSLERMLRLAIAASQRALAAEVSFGSCVDGARGSRVFLAISLRSGASHVSGLFVRRIWPLALM